MFIKKSMDELDRLSLSESKLAEKHPFIVILDDVRSMHNVGSVFRTCDAFAASSLFLCGYTPCPPHRDIHKTALGATETVNWKHFPNTLEAVHFAKKEGYKICCIEQVHNSLPLNSFTFNKNKTAFVFGNEVSGVNPDVLSFADCCIEIPQWGSKHSLNISVSVGVVLWELARG